MSDEQVHEEQGTINDLMRRIVEDHEVDVHGHGALSSELPTEEHPEPVEVTEHVFDAPVAPAGHVAACEFAILTDPACSDRWSKHPKFLAAWVPSVAAGRTVEEVVVMARRIPFSAINAAHEGAVA